jgi:hypothetical protein
MDQAQHGLYKCKKPINFFSALNRAWKTLENDEGYRKCQEIVEEAVVRTEDMVTNLFILSPSYISIFKCDVLKLYGLEMLICKKIYYLFMYIKVAHYQ